MQHWSCQPTLRELESYAYDKPGRQHSHPGKSAVAMQPVRANRLIDEKSSRCGHHDYQVAPPLPAEVRQQTFAQTAPQQLQRKRTHRRSLTY